MKEINIDHYVQLDKENPKRTEERLNQLKSIGLKQVGIAQFGIDGIISGIYIERVWNQTSSEWKDEIIWIKDVINRNNESSK